VLRDVATARGEPLAGHPLAARIKSAFAESVRV
jgi:hypothetical protein